MNVLNLFDRTNRRTRSHGSRRYKKPEIHDVSFDGLLSFVNLQLGLHHIRTRLYSLPSKMLRELYESILTFHFTDVASAEHRFQGIILEIPSNRLFNLQNRPFLKLKIANLSKMLNQKSVQNKVTPNFQYKESPCISYSYTRSVVSNIFNYKANLQQIDSHGLSQNPTPCSCCALNFYTLYEAI